MAQDDFLPRAFAVVGRRLVFSVGILFLSAAAGILLIAFGGITDRLIPLFAVGAFLTFTMSQLGMVAHWRRELGTANNARERHKHRASLAINLTGTVITAVSLAIIVIAKFTEGAWITIVVIPFVIVLLTTIKRYYASLDAQLREDGPIDLRGIEPPVVLVVTEGWNRLTDRALNFAMRLSPDVAEVHLTALAGPDVNENGQELRCQWTNDVEKPAEEAGLRPPQLVLLQAPYRRIQAPLLQLIQATEQDHPNRVIAVLIPEVVKEYWWQYLLHIHRAHRLRSALLRYGGSRVIVIKIPWISRSRELRRAWKKPKKLSH